MQAEPTQQALETWVLRKPAVETDTGLVASQHYLASEVGAEVLRDGGNAIDAAVAASIAIGTQEPWMSGLGGGGFMMIYLAEEDTTYVVDFGMIAPRRLDPADYPLASGAGSELFNWPAVVDDRNLRGYPAIAVPGYTAGLALALERFGSRSWADSLAPAIELAQNGLAVDWYATLKIATAARDLARFPESQKIYLPDGFAPAGEWGGPLPRIKLGHLADTLIRLAEAGANDFYQGDIANAIVADLAAGGNRITVEDLAGYRPRICKAGTTRYRDNDIHFAPGLTAGPTLQRAFGLLAEQWLPSSVPDAAGYAAYARVLQIAYAERLAQMGDSNETSDPSCTTHLSVVDQQGNLVALTQTLLSVFGSKVVLPQTGILMNNGIMWFDPRPGRPNSIAAGKRPLSNMCPTIIKRSDGFRFAIGASGGRRIMPAVFQLSSFLTDYRMSMDAAFHQPRLDVSGTDTVTLDNQLSHDIMTTLSEQFRVEVAQHGVYPALFACPNSVGFDPRSGQKVGAAFVPSPWARVCSA
jgi:gamma-glutamyltranspeptidase/glutathione hydrolase